MAKQSKSVVKPPVPEDDFCALMSGELLSGDGPEDEDESKSVDIEQFFDSINPMNMGGYWPEPPYQKNGKKKEEK